MRKTHNAQGRNNLQSNEVMELLLYIYTKIKHRNAYIGYKARIVNSRLADKVRIFRQARIVNSVIGYDSHVSTEAIVRNTYVGQRTGIAERAIVGVYNRRNKRTIIGDNVMIGTGAIVFEGVKIGSGAWIGAGTVVRSNVKKNAVVVGNPAKLVRYLTEDSVVMG